MVNIEYNLTLQEAILFVERALDVAGYEYSDKDDFNDVCKGDTFIGTIKVTVE